MQLEVHELIWFRLGMMFDAIELYSLTLVSVTLTFIHGHNSVRKQKCLGQLSRKVFYQFRWSVA